MVKIRNAQFIFLLLTFFLLTFTRLAAQQTPYINYQGVARKADGSPVMEQAIKLRLTILDGSATGNNVYSETRQPTTNKFGLFTVVIGSAGALSQSGTIAAINWASGNKFLQVELDPQGGNSFINMGSSQLQTVPYAIYATSAHPSGSAGGDLGGSFPNPTVNKLQGYALSSAAPVNGQILKWNGTAWAPGDASSATGTISGNLPITSTMQGANSTISINRADAATDGYLSKADWLIFNNKASISSVNDETTRAIAAEVLKENKADKSINITADAASDTKYPSVKSVKTYVDAAIVANNTPDATTLAAGKIQLAGDLEGNAAAPQIAPGKITTAKLSDASVTDAKIANGINASKVGLGNVDNTSDANKPVSTATQTALDAKASSTDLALKAPLASPTFTGTVAGITAAMVGLDNVSNTSDANKPVSTATQTALDAKASSTDLALKAPLASPTFTGTVAGITAAMVGLGNVTNTSDANKPVSTATQTALDLKAPLASPTFTGTVAGITAAMVGLGNADNTSDANKPVSTATQTALDAKASSTDLALKAPLASPTFTGTVAGITAAMVGLDNVSNTSDANKPVSTATQTALDAKASSTDLALKAPLASPTFTGTVAGITAAMVGLGNVTNTSDANKPVSTATQTALDLKAPLASPTFTGTVAGITAAMVGLGNADNTSDANKPVSTATQTALDAKASSTDLALKAPLASPTFTGTVAGITAAMVGLGNVTNTSDANKPVSTATQTALDLKAPLASPTFTGTVAGITAAMVGLGNVTNTSDANKPVSTATQTALDLKAPLASPTFTGTVAGISAAMVGLGNADNTSDANKPVSTATQTALDAKASSTDLALKAPLASPTFTGTVAGITAAMVGLGNVTNTSDANKPVSTATQTALDLKAPLASPTFTGTVAGITAAMVGLGNVTNTSDANKPVSTATQTALDLKAPLASPTFTGTVAGISAAMVGLGNVTNTSDANKPVSTATQTALDQKAPLASPTFTGTTTVSGSITGGNAAASTLAGFSANINTQSGTSYTLTSADNGKIITLNNAGAITLTVPSLYAGFNCMIVQTGAGQVTLTASGVTLSNRSSYTKTAGTNAIATIIALTSTSFISSGDMSN